MFIWLSVAMLEQCAHGDAVPDQVDALEEALTWPSYCLSVLQARAWGLTQIGLHWKQLTISTALSGMDALGTAAALCWCILHCEGGRRHRIRRLSAIEWFGESRDELRYLPEPP